MKRIWYCRYLCIFL